MKKITYSHNGEVRKTIVSKEIANKIIEQLKQDGFVVKSIHNHKQI